MDKSSSRTEKEQTLSIVVGKIFCLSAPLVSQHNADLFWLFKATSGLGISRVALEEMIVKEPHKLQETPRYFYRT